MTTKNMIDFSSSRRFDADHIEWHNVEVKIGALILNFRLSNQDRLDLIELLSGASKMAQVELVGISPLRIPTKGQRVLEITPEVLNVRQVDMSQFGEKEKES